MYANFIYITSHTHTQKKKNVSSNDTRDLTKKSIVLVREEGAKKKKKTPVNRIHICVYLQ